MNLTRFVLTWTYSTTDCVKTLRVLGYATTLRARFFSDGPWHHPATQPEQLGDRHLSIHTPRKAQTSLVTVIAEARHHHDRETDGTLRGNQGPYSDFKKVDTLFFRASIRIRMFLRD